MLTRRPSLQYQCGRLCNITEFCGSRSNNGDDRRIDSFRSSIRASGSREGRASLAYVRSLSRKGLKAQQESTRSVADAAASTVVERLHVIPYSDLVLKRKLDSGLSLIENEYCWEDDWKLYMQSQTATLKELAARVQECNPQIDSTTVAAPLPIQQLESKERGSASSAQEKQPSFLSDVRAKKLGKRRTRGLMLLNVLAALYGSSTVAGKFATDVAPGLPASLSTLVRFSSALLVFLPALRHVHRNPALLKAGAELGGLLFAAALVETCGDGGASSDAPLLFAFTVIFVPIMELCAGRQSVRNITRIASLVALSGMGVLEEEGLGWKGISLPQVGDAWGLAASAIYALHIFRSEAHSKKFKPFQLTAIQCGTVAALSLIWELSRVLHAHTISAADYVSQLQALPWLPLVYAGLVCSGLCSWLEIHGLRSVQASTATMVNTTIPIWGAFLSFFLRGDKIDDSAIVGGSVILVASVVAQLISKQDENSQRKRKRNETPAKPVGDHVQGAIITSQLKFPYYAAQAKRLLVDAKMKLLSVKSLVMSATLLTTNPPSAPSGSVHSAIATGVTVGAANSSSSGTGAPAALVDIATGVLEAAITALGSDLVQSFEEAEDIAKLLEQAAQTAMDHMAMAMASWSSLESVDITTTTALVENSVDCAVPLIAHHAHTVLHVLLTCSSNPN